jgi:hypothetical protein
MAVEVTREVGGDASVTRAELRSAKFLWLPAVSRSGKPRIA